MGAHAGASGRRLRLVLAEVPARRMLRRRWKVDSMKRSETMLLVEQAIRETKRMLREIQPALREARREVRADARRAKAARTRSR